MKRFSDKHEPIEVELESKAGEVFPLCSKFISLEVQDEMEEILRDSSKTEASKVIEIMIIAFGKDSTFWKQFSANTLQGVSEYIQDENKKKLNSADGSTT